MQHKPTQFSALAWPRCLLGGVVRKYLRHAGSSSSLGLLVAGLLAAFWGAPGRGDLDCARRARLGPTSSRLLVLRVAGASAGVREWGEGGGRGVAVGGLLAGPARPGDCFAASCSGTLLQDRPSTKRGWDQTAELEACVSSVAS